MFITIFGFAWTVLALLWFVFKLYVAYDAARCPLGAGGGSTLDGALFPVLQREVAEREGFEPSVVISYARFPGVCLKPLSHLSDRAESERKIFFARPTGKGKLIQKSLEPARQS